MKLRTAFVILGLVFGLGAGASSAHAAKGVKKNANSGVHVHHGVVTHVDHKAGHFTILAHHSKKKNNMNAQAGAQAKHVHFKVNGSTKFVVGNGQNKTPTNFAALRAGEHVTVGSQQGTAEGVVIHKSQKKKPNKKPNNK
jgi:hypothetical protein